MAKNRVSRAGKRHGKSHHHVQTIRRELLAADPRRSVRQRATRAIEVVYEDASLVRGCAVAGRWECVVPAKVERA